MLQGRKARELQDSAMRRFRESKYWSKTEGCALGLHVKEDCDLTIRPEDGQCITVVIDENTEVTIFERGSGNFTVDILCGENARLHYISASSGVTVRRFAYLERDASLLWVDAAYGGAQTHVTSYLGGMGASAEFESVLLGRNDERYVVRSNMVHAADNGTSNMLTRAVMFDESKGDYAGTIKINPDARGCDAYQKEDTLMMSRSARMDAQPNLEISNEDVSCSHGASLGQVDEEEIFYFLSRGIPRKQAVQLIVQGFFDTVLARMGGHAEGVRSEIYERIEVTHED